MMGQGHGVKLYYGTVFMTQLLKKPRINSEKPINKAITSPQNSLTVKFIRHNIGPVLTSEWPVIDNISPFLRRSLIPSETVSLIPKQLYCTFLLSLSSLIKHKWRSLSRAFLQLNEIFRNTFLIAYHCWSYLACEQALWEGTLWRQATGDFFPPCPQSSTESLLAG